LNERVAFLAAILSAEIGSCAIFLVSHYGATFATPENSSVDLAAEHAAIVAAVWILLASFSWLLAPKLWRIRQNLSTKLRLLGVICVLALAVDNLVSFSLLTQSLTAAPAAQSLDRPVPSLAPLLALRSAAALVFFWLAVLVTERINHHLRPHVTPAPKFGRE